MTIIEYPKALYKGGEYLAVADKAEESERRKEGFLDWQADYDRMMAVSDIPGTFDGGASSVTVTVGGGGGTGYAKRPQLSLKTP